MASNRQCLACKTGYSYCPSCSRVDKLAPAWKAQFCSEDCMTLWTVATKFNMKKIGIKEAQEQISVLNLKDRSQYAPCIQRDLNNIFAEDKKPKRGKRIEIKPIDEFADIEPVIEIEQPAEVAEPTHEVVFEKE